MNNTAPLEIVKITVKWTKAVSTHGIGSFFRDSLVTINVKKDIARLIKHLENAKAKHRIDWWVIKPVKPEECMTINEFLEML